MRAKKGVMAEGPVGREHSCGALHSREQRKGSSLKVNENLIIYAFFLGSWVVSGEIPGGIFWFY